MVHGNLPTKPDDLLCCIWQVNIASINLYLGTPGPILGFTMQAVL